MTSMPNRTLESVIQQAQLGVKPHILTAKWTQDSRETRKGGAAPSGDVTANSTTSTTELVLPPRPPRAKLRAFLRMTKDTRARQVVQERTMESNEEVF